MKKTIEKKNVVSGGEKNTFKAKLSQLKNDLINNMLGWVSPISANSRTEYMNLQSRSASQSEPGKTLTAYGELSKRITPIEEQQLPKPATFVVQTKVTAIQSQINAAVITQHAEKSDSDSESDDDSYLNITYKKENEKLKEKIAPLSTDLEELRISIAALGKLNSYSGEQFKRVNQSIATIHQTYFDHLQKNATPRRLWMDLCNQYSEIHGKLLKAINASDAYKETGEKNPLLNKLKFKILPMLHICENLSQALRFDSKSCEQLLLFLDLLTNTIGVSGTRKLTPDMVAMNAIIQGNDTLLQNKLNTVLSSILEKLLTICFSATLKEGTIKDDAVIVNGQQIKLNPLFKSIEILLTLNADISKRLLPNLSFEEMVKFLNSNVTVCQKIIMTECYVANSQAIENNYQILELLHDAILDFQNNVLASCDRDNSDPYLANAALTSFWKILETISTDNFINDFDNTDKSQSLYDRILLTKSDISKLRLSPRCESRLFIAVVACDLEEVRSCIAEQKATKTDFHTTLELARDVSANVVASLDKCFEGSAVSPQARDADYISQMINYLESKKIISSKMALSLASMPIYELEDTLLNILHYKKSQAEQISSFLSIPLFSFGSSIEVELTGKIVRINTDDIKNIAYLAGGEFGVVYSAEYSGSDPDFLKLFPGRMIVFKELRSKKVNDGEEFERERAMSLHLFELSKKRPGLYYPACAKAQLKYFVQADANKRLRQAATAVTNILISEYIVGQYRRDRSNKAVPVALKGEDMTIILRNKSAAEQLMILYSISMQIIYAELSMIDLGVLHLDAALRNIIIQINSDGTYKPFITDVGLSRKLSTHALENGRRFTLEAENVGGQLPIFALSSQRLMGHGGLVEESAGPYELRVLLLGFISLFYDISMDKYICAADLSAKIPNQSVNIPMYKIYLDNYAGRFDFDVIDKENIERYFKNISYIISEGKYKSKNASYDTDKILKHFYESLKPYILGEFTSLKGEFLKFQNTFEATINHSIDMMFSEYYENGNIDEFASCLAHLRNMLITLSQVMGGELTGKWKNILEKVDVMQQKYTLMGRNSLQLKEVMPTLIEDFNVSFLTRTAKERTPKIEIKPTPLRLKPGAEVSTSKNALEQSRVAAVTTPRGLFSQPNKPVTQQNMPKTTTTTLPHSLTKPTGK